MIVESAFNILPESIAGLGFQKVKREANAVSAFSFSLLNALHAKNVVDPIQRLQQEQSYATKSLPLPPQVERCCDVFIDYGGSKIGSSALANFGWRYRNYVEAKFLKSYDQTKTGQDTRAFANSAEIIADLIRLVSLVPEPELSKSSATPRTSSARYFLVLSDKPLTVFLLKYLKHLHSVFENPSRTAQIELDLTTGKPSTKLAEKVGTTFNKLRVHLKSCTCTSHFPLEASKPDSCWMLLLRIDAAKIELSNGAATHNFEFKLDRSLSEGAPGDYKTIRDFVAANLK